ncbi:DUF1206 domain-containing protein [Loktanella agnita]|uniref:DUF1206 domain-containing protein n=1 Tax=Loktanella agnita TaxID=287097 RepID=UPI00398A4CF0
MRDNKMDWAMPVMRMGYAGRGMTYVAIAGLSLWTIWKGGQAQGTSEALKSIETSPFGMFILVLIGVGLLCYTAWRVIDGIADLEEEGNDTKGLVARVGMVVTGLIHAAIGIAAISLVFGRNDGGGEGSRIAEFTQMIMSAPLGVWLVGAAGLATLGAGIYYLYKAWRRTYRQKLAANRFTTGWDTTLRFGVAAQGVVVSIIGGFLIYAFWTRDADQAGGMDKAFSWLQDQVYGQVLVTLLCFGLLAFALFLFVNARYRTVPRLSDPDIRSLADEFA